MLRNTVSILMPWALVCAGLLGATSAHGDLFDRGLSHFTVMDNPLAVAAADLNGDSIPDLAVANSQSNTVSVLISLGEGFFLPDASFGVGSSPVAIIAEDLDDDSIPDLAVVNGTSDDVSILLGNGDGTFPYEAAVGDLDLDGIPDVAVANGQGNDVSVLLGLGNGTLEPAQAWCAGGVLPTSVIVEDLDGDGDADLAVANSLSDSVSVLTNTTITWKSLGADLTCLPASGTVAFVTQMTVTLENRYTGQLRRLAGRIDVRRGDGASFSNWKSGYTNVAAGSDKVFSWNQNIPALGSLIGDNLFELLAEDVTPSPYNQPPYPPSGDTDSGGCTVTGYAP